MPSIFEPVEERSTWELDIKKGTKHTAEQIVNLLRQVEVGVADGQTLPQACKEADRGADVLPITQGVRRVEGEPNSAAEGTGSSRTQS